MVAEKLSGDGISTAWGNVYFDKTLLTTALSVGRFEAGNRNEVLGVWKRTRYQRTAGIDHHIILGHDLLLIKATIGSRRQSMS